MFILAVAAFPLIASCSDPGHGHSSPSSVTGSRTAGSVGPASPSPDLSVIPPGATPPGPAPGSTPASRWASCLTSHGLQLNHPWPSRDPSGHIRLAVEACASQAAGMVLSIPIVKGDRFQACLRHHDPEIPVVKGRLALNTGTPAIAAAIKTCSP